MPAIRLPIVERGSPRTKFPNFDHNGEDPKYSYSSADIRGGINGGSAMEEGKSMYSYIKLRLTQSQSAHPSTMENESDPIDVA
jgi:hypothetical protein